jgi:hypothetical protein
LVLAEQAAHQALAVAVKAELPASVPPWAVCQQFLAATAVVVLLAPVSQVAPAMVQEAVAAVIAAVLVVLAV